MGIPLSEDDMPTTKTCPPCNHDCNEGRACPARLAMHRIPPAEASSDIGAEELPRRLRPVWSVAAALGSWAVFLLGVAAYMRWAH